MQVLKADVLKVISDVAAEWGNEDEQDLTEREIGAVLRALAIVKARVELLESEETDELPAYGHA